MRRLLVAACAVAVVLQASSAHAQSWGEFQHDNCTSIGYRQHSAILWDIPWGWDWEDTCAVMPATIDGYDFTAPARCVNTGTNIWGEFDVPDSSCTPYWGEYQDDDCRSRGLRQYSAILWNVQPDLTWEGSCAAMPASPAGQYFATPARCVNTGLNMWGEWDVTDGSCVPSWGTISGGTCKSGTLGVRTYSAILWNIPPDETWEYACANAPATVNNTYFASPTRCVNTGLNMWGEWDAPDTGCTPSWGATQDGGCIDLEHRKYSAILENIPAGYSWETACANTPATVAGQFFPTPTNCVNVLGIAMWGEFLVNDASCAPTWGQFTDRCTDLGVRTYSATLDGIPFGYSWEAACWDTPATVMGQEFATPTRCVNFGPGIAMYGEFDLADNSCPHWGSFQKDDCRDSGRRQYSAVLRDIPFGASWEEACAATPATVEGVYFSHPTRCVNELSLNMWGQFEVFDPTCNPVTECTDVTLPAGAFLKPGNDGSVSCDAYCANRDQDWGARGACVKGFIQGGENDGMCLSCIDVGDDFDADEVECYCKSQPLLGFADVHSHQFANEGFGGRAFVGRAFGPIAEALPHCDDVHGPGGLGDGLANLLGSIVYWNQGPGHRVGGFDEFDGWPRWNSTTHQAVYEDWLFRAYQGGLRLMVTHAVNNEDIFGFPLFVSKAEGRTGGDMEAVNLQLDEAYAMQDYIDTKAGGPGLGWYRIVTSADQARAVVESGKLAVVLGVEVDNLFGCYANATCTEAYVRAELDKLYQRGVRHVYPIHFKANAFGGAALSHQLTSGPERDCAAEGYEHKCSALGLTAIGRFLVTELMRRRMIIDIDHLSALSFDDMLDIAEQYRYPVVSGHTGFIDTSIGEKRNESNLMAAQVARIRGVGGLLAAIVHQGGVGEISTWRGENQPVVEHRCGGTSQSWAQAYLYSVKAMQGGAVAIGTDFNGMAGLPGPRFAPPGITPELLEACPGSPIWDKPRETAMVSYPLSVPVQGTTTRLDRSVVGNQTFDYNLDGLAHVGMLPDFIADLKAQGLRPEDLEPLYRSAEGYVALWERAEAAGAFIPTLDEIAAADIQEGAGLQTVDLTGITGGGAEGAEITVTAASSNPDLIPDPTVSYVSPGTTGSLSFSPVADANGSATITVTVRTGSGANQALSRTFSVSVAAVNDVPSFAKGADQTVLEDAGAQTVVAWANAISAGPPDEATQLLTFVATNDNNPLFAVQPAVSAGGELTFTPAENASGSASVTLVLSDSGGTANGGVDTSPPQTLVISVTPVNDPPVAVDDGASTVVGADWRTIAVLANDTAAPDTGETLSITEVSAGVHGEARIAAGGTAVEYRPTDGLPGTDEFSYTIDDGNGGSASATVRVGIVPPNQPPVFAPVGPQEVAAGIPLSFSVHAGDPESDAVAVEMLAGPPGAVFNQATLVFSWTPLHAQALATPWLASFGATDTGTPPALAVPLDVPITVTPALCFDDFADGTKSGDPDWLERKGDWTVDAAQRLASSLSKSNLATARSPVVARVATGRIAAKVTLGRGAVPNATLVFSLRSKLGRLSYRYVSILKDRLVIGDTTGRRSQKILKFVKGRAYLVAVDLAADGRVTVAVDGVARHTFKFAKPLAGQVGVVVDRARSFFDDFTVWSESMLP